MKNQLPVAAADELRRVSGREVGGRRGGGLGLVVLRCHEHVGGLQGPRPLVQVVATSLVVGSACRIFFYSKSLTVGKSSSLLWNIKTSSFHDLQACFISTQLVLFKNAKKDKNKKKGARIFITILLYFHLFPKIKFPPNFYQNTIKHTRDFFYEKI